VSTYIYIDGWKSNLRFSSAHIIPEYEKCGRLHGHTYAVYAKISGKYDKNGIIMDFSLLKNTLKQITDELDHKVLIPEISQVKQKPFVELVHEILAVKKKDPKTDTTELETKIDQMVYKLYDLTPDEIAIVEGSNK